MFTFKFETESLIKRLAEARKRFSKAVANAVWKSARFAAEHARKTKSFKNRSGELRRSIKTVRVSEFEAFTDATAKHACWVERGNGFRTNAEYIYPKTKPVLVFKIDGRKIVASRVRTSKPRLFMQEAAQEAKPFFEGLCLDAATNLVD